jgi:hypothetical protein
VTRENITKLKNQSILELNTVDRMFKASCRYDRFSKQPTPEMTKNGYQNNEKHQVADIGLTSLRHFDRTNVVLYATPEKFFQPMLWSRAVHRRSLPRYEKKHLAPE